MKAYQITFVVNTLTGKHFQLTTEAADMAAAKEFARDEAVRRHFYGQILVAEVA